MINTNSMNLYPILLLTACLTAGCGGVGGSDGARQLGFYSEMARSYYDENDGVPTGRRSLVGQLLFQPQHRLDHRIPADAAAALTRLGYEVSVRQAKVFAAGFLQILPNYDNY